MKDGRKRLVQAASHKTSKVSAKTLCNLPTTTDTITMMRTSDSVVRDLFTKSFSTHLPNARQIHA